MRLYETYKDVKIFHNEDNDMWYADNVKLHVDIEAGKLSDLKSKVDKTLKSKFELFDVYYRTFGEYIKVTVTSINDNGQVWISYKNKFGKNRREKLRSDQELYIDNKKNESTIISIESLDVRINKLENEKSKLIETLDKVDLTQQQS